MMGEPSAQAVYVVAEGADLVEALGFLVSSADLPAVTFDSLDAFLSAYEPAWRGCLVIEVSDFQDQWQESIEAVVLRGVDLPVILIGGPPRPARGTSRTKWPRVEFLVRPVTDELLLDRVSKALRWDASRRED
jgi:FixJ family two-component response regulator